jgi:hypothetical protein
MNLTRDEREELDARIERRVIVSVGQLTPEAVRGEKLEARNMDVTGKTTIVRQAAAASSLVEITPSGALSEGSGQEGIKRVYGVPVGLEKGDGDTVLVLKQEGEPLPVRIPMGKIRVIRRIKKSIFEN